MRTPIARAARELTLASLGMCLTAAPAALHAQLLTFEGVGNDAPIGAFYAGLGITFSDNAFAYVRSNVPGGAGNFGGEPSPTTAALFTDFPGTPAYFNVAGGFMTGLGLFYSAPGVPVTVRVFSGLNGTGSLLAELLLPVTPNGSVMGCANNPGATFCPFAPAGVAFAGTARSVDFGGALNDATFDNITLGQVAPAVIPEPSTVALLAGGLLGVAGVCARRRRHLPPAGSGSDAP